MTLILRKSGKVGDRTRWNLSFSGISLSHKRGWLTLNSRGRSVIDLPGPHFTFRVGPTGTVLWFIAFVLFDLAVLLLKLLVLPLVLAIDGTHELASKQPSTEGSTGLIMLAGAVLLAGLYAWAYLYFFG